MSEVHPATRRETKYTVAVRAAVQRLGHASNAEIAGMLRDKYPDLSDTTVHRVTQRLYADGELGVAPSTEDGAVRYDSVATKHDHFLCRACGALRDMQVPQACRALIQHQLGGCKVGGSLTVTGECQRCAE